MTVDMEVARLKARADKAITGLRMAGHIRAPMEWLMRNITAFADKNGVAFPSVETLAECMQLSPRAVNYQLRLLRQKYPDFIGVALGGGAHRTNRYVLKIGPWQLNPSHKHMQDEFSERWRQGNEAAELWLIERMREHLRLGYACCRKFAFRWLKAEQVQPPLWAAT